MMLALAEEVVASSPAKIMMIAPTGPKICSATTVRGVRVCSISSWVKTPAVTKTTIV